MKRVSNNIKFYVFIDILRTYSDSNVSLSIKEIQHHMERRLGVMVDRRTIYSYIKDMRALGMDVSEYDKNKEGYYLSSNYFEADEVRILADAILTSSFITRSKTEELLEKLKSFNSIYQNKDFSRAVFVEDIPKSVNEEIFENLIKIYEAIRLDRKIIFNYCDYDYCKNLVSRVDDEGKQKSYKVNPIYIVLRNESYYLACLDDATDDDLKFKDCLEINDDLRINNDLRVKNGRKINDFKVDNNLGANGEFNILKDFRVDRMLNVSIAYDEEIEELDVVHGYRKSLSDVEYLSKNVKMVPGRDIIVVVEFKQKMLNYILDKFGDYIYIMEKDNYRNNNLGEDVREESLHFQILYKIFGKRDYDEYILSGKYIEDSQTREKFEDFKKMLDNLRTDSGLGGDSCIDSMIDDDLSMNLELGDLYAEGQKTTLDEVQEATLDKTLDEHHQKKYIGIFIAKESPKLARWLMQFGTDMRVIWPQTLENIMIDEIDKLKQFYL
ncbi:helix-turn-helix transcriptional regulator [Intestinibacter bartlettii]|uniref:WYL domain-containing protein n=1 Tax=Intestinibacter bartlettii TaxID=261299 RepID=A0ABS6DZW5_9FIRM|nr:WYL domain-containing protein [Intestinibacter bartlettii]MBU5337388.1 WYL domain-containing protein [Intestinibacter bartlettii]